MEGLFSLENWGHNLCISMCQAWDARLGRGELGRGRTTPSQLSALRSLQSPKEAKGYPLDQHCPTET